MCLPDREPGKSARQRGRAGRDIECRCVIAMCCARVCSAHHASKHRPASLGTADDGDETTCGHARRTPANRARVRRRPVRFAAHSRAVIRLSVGGIGRTFAAATGAGFARNPSPTTTQFPLGTVWTHRRRSQLERVERIVPARARAARLGFRPHRAHRCRRAAACPTEHRRAAGCRRAARAIKRQLYRVKHSGVRGRPEWSPRAGRHGDIHLREPDAAERGRALAPHRGRAHRRRRRAR